MMEFFDISELDLSIFYLLQWFLISHDLVSILFRRWKEISWFILFGYLLQFSFWIDNWHYLDHFLCLFSTKKALNKKHLKFVEILMKKHSDKKSLVQYE
jgi:hypothetical protein